MKKIISILVFCFLVLPLVNLGAEEVIGTIKPNVLNPNRLDVVDDQGRSNYYLERDILRPERWIIYHRDSMHKAGYIERNPLRLYDYDIKVKRPSGVRVKSVNPSGTSVKFRRFTK